MCCTFVVVGAFSSSSLLRQGNISRRHSSYSDPDTQISHLVQTCHRVERSWHACDRMVLSNNLPLHQQKLARGRQIPGGDDWRSHGSNTQQCESAEDGRCETDCHAPTIDRGAA